MLTQRALRSVSSNKTKATIASALRWALPAAAWLCVSAAFAADGGWKFAIDEREHPELRYLRNDKAVFYVGCGHTFGLHAVYPGRAKKDGAKATLVMQTERRG